MTEKRNEDHRIMIFDGNSYYDPEYIEEYKQGLDIPDNEVYSMIADEQSFDFEELVNNQLGTFIEDEGPFILFGSLGLWNGRPSVCKIVKDMSDLGSAFKDTDLSNIVIYDENGHLHIQASHHDGTNCFELRKLNKKGIAYYERHEDEFDYKHGATLAKPGYSVLPRYVNDATE